MPITLKTLHARAQDYFLARLENNEFTMEPYCSCGNQLEEDYTCSQCKRDCTCTFIACEDPQALAFAERLIASNPGFKNFQAMLIGD